MPQLLTRPTLTGRSPLPLPGTVDPHRPALVDPDGHVIDHAGLRQRVEEFAAALPPALDARLLTHVRLRPTLDSIVAYLGVLEAGHVALVTSDQTHEALQRHWPADLLVDDDTVTRTSPSPAYLLHPDLALLLSTSGSTSSPKLVRLSHDNLLSNARGIAHSLGLGAEDRGITSLPLHYTYGLSVLHSHLAVGGSVALTDQSVLDQGFWDVVDAGVTTLAVVPHMIELAETTGVLDRPHPSLRLITQAGGRMGPERVARTTALGRTHGWGLSLMYGQTEATARITVQHPDITVGSPGTVGRPLPETTITIDTRVPEADREAGTGEIVVRGPGVMLGYADHPDDLALGRMVTELRTGDLGGWRDGLLQIVGRRSGFVKVLGLRIDLGRVEAALERSGLVACVTGDDTGLRVGVDPVPGQSVEHTSTLARRLAAEACGLGVGHVRVAVIGLPRLASGKLDRAGCDLLVRGSDPDECVGTRQQIDSPGLAVRAAAVLRRVLGRDQIDLELSFVAQGGDSLSHVQAALALGEVLGDLPTDWHHRPLAELVRDAEVRHRDDPATPTTRGRRSWRRMETTAVLRALAVVMIAGSHANLFRLPGGAHTLMAVVGFNAALFGLSALGIGQRWRGTARLLIGIAVPTMAVAALGMATGRYGVANLLLANWATGDVNRLQRNELWFVDAVVLCLLVTTAVLSVPTLSRLWASHPWRVSLGLLLVGLVSRFAVLGLFEGTLRGIMPTVFFLFAAGLALAQARSRGQRLLTLALAAVGVVDFFPGDLLRNGIILAGISALALLRTVPVPAMLVTPVSVLAAASLHVYLVQFHILDWLGRPLLGTVLSVAVGVALWRLSERPIRRLQALVPHRAAPAAPVSPEPRGTLL